MRHRDVTLKKKKKGEEEKEGKPDFTVRVNLANIERKSDVN